MPPKPMSPRASLGGNDGREFVDRRPRVLRAGNSPPCGRLLRVPALCSAHRLILTAALAVAVGTGCSEISAVAPADAGPSTGASVPATAGAQPLTATVADLRVFWQQLDPDKLSAGPRLVIALGDRKTGCGKGTQDEGSFFCADDATIYLQQVDLDAMADLSVQARTASEVYLVAHEYGHYVQDRLGVAEGKQDAGPESDSVHYELQADCLAGAYVAHRDDAVSPAAFTEAVRLGGDDVGAEPLPPEKFGHGSATQRVAAFGRGLRAGATACGLPT